MAATEVFSTDPEFIDVECRWMKCRTQRIQAEKNAETERNICDDDPEVASRYRVAARNSKCRVIELQAAEDKLRRQIDERLGVLRADHSRPKLGLDELTDTFHLTPEMRLVLLTAMVPALSSRAGEDVLSGIGCAFYAAVSPQDCIAMLAPRNMVDWLRYRSLFRPGSPLVKNQLLIVKPNDKVVSPGTLMTAEVTVSLTAFAKIIGDPDAAHELPESQS